GGHGGGPEGERRAHDREDGRPQERDGGRRCGSPGGRSRGRIQSVRLHGRRRVSQGAGGASDYLQHLAGPLDVGRGPAPAVLHRAQDGRGTARPVRLRKRPRCRAQASGSPRGSRGRGIVHGRPHLHGEDHHGGLDRDGHRALERRDRRDRAAAEGPAAPLQGGPPDPTNSGRGRVLLPSQDPPSEWHAHHAGLHHAVQARERGATGGRVEGAYLGHPGHRHGTGGSMAGC
ncbi:unnamed protein product, partial [Ectocarpus fasciculatus]